VYLTAVMDWYSRKVLSWEVSDHGVFSMNSSSSSESAVSRPAASGGLATYLHRYLRYPARLTKIKRESLEKLGGVALARVAPRVFCDVQRALMGAVFSERPFSGGVQIILREKRQ
jgi:hypothetical protein